MDHYMKEHLKIMLKVEKVDKFVQMGACILYFLCRYEGNFNENEFEGYGEF